MKRLTGFLAALAVAALGAAAPAFADGTETLGTPSVPVASGTGLVAAGVGTEVTQPGTITVTVPGAVKQALLYWQGHYSTSLGATGDDTVVLGTGGIATKTFGKTAAGTAFGFPGADRKYGNKFTLPESGALTGIVARMKGSGLAGSQSFRTMVYAANGPGGAPGTLIATSATLTIPGSTVEGPVTFPISPKVTAPAGDYWLMQHAGPASATVGLSQIKPAATQNNYNIDVFADGPSNPAGPVNVEGGEYTLSATYEVTAGTTVTGTRIGGPTTFFTSGGNDMTFASYRADITGLGVVQSGANSIVVSGLGFVAGDGFGNDGVGLVVVYDNGSQTTALGLRDGQDLVFRDFASPLNTTVPQTFAFPAASIARNATLSTLAGSVQGPASGQSPLRPNMIRITFDTGAPVEIVNPFASNQGPEFDAANLAFTVPAGATSLTVQALSAGTGGLPASFSWLAAGVTLQSAPPACSLGDLVWKDANRNGLQDDGTASGINGVQLRLYDVQGRQFIGSTTTANDPASATPGWYRFTIPCGTKVMVKVSLGNFMSGGALAGLLPTVPNAGADDAVDSDGIPVFSPFVTVPSGHNPTIDFGYVAKKQHDECKDDDKKWNRTTSSRGHDDDCDDDRDDCKRSSHSSKSSSKSYGCDDHHGKDHDKDKDKDKDYGKDGKRGEQRRH